VTLTLEVGIYNWYATHHLVMMHVSMKFHVIIFILLNLWSGQGKGIFDI